MCMEEIFSVAYVLNFSPAAILFGDLLIILSYLWEEHVRFQANLMGYCLIFSIVFPVFPLKLEGAGSACLLNDLLGGTHNGGGRRSSSDWKRLDLLWETRRGGISGGWRWKGWQGGAPGQGEPSGSSRGLGEGIKPKLKPTPAWYEGGLGLSCRESGTTLKLLSNVCVWDVVMWQLFSWKEVLLSDPNLAS